MPSKLSNLGSRIAGFVSGKPAVYLTSVNSNPSPAREEFSSPSEAIEHLVERSKSEPLLYPPGSKYTVDMLSVRSVFDSASATYVPRIKISIDARGRVRTKSL
jgi:hypothetical protein